MVTEEIVGSRLNVSVAAFRGHTRAELLVIGGITLTVSLLVFGALTRLLFGWWMLGIGFAFPLSIVLGWGIASFLQRYKSDKPTGYLKQLVLCYLADKRLITSPYVRYSGIWLTRREFSWHL